MTRLEQINESYPKKNGLFVQYDKKGFIKVKGKMKNGELIKARP